MGKYKVGTISAILAKEGGGGDNEVDPKLAALFGGGGGAKVFKMVKVKEEEIGGGPRGKKKEVTTEVTGDEGGKKKRKKKGVQDGTISSTIEEEVTMEEPVKKKKKKEGNVTKVTTEEDGGGVTKKDKKKAKKGVKLVTNGGDVEKSKKKGVKLEETGDDKEIVTKKDKKKKGVEMVTNGGDVKKKDKKKKKGVKLEEAGDDEEDDEEMTVDVPEKKEEVTKTLAEKNAPKPKDPELEARTIFVGNLPGLVEKKELKKLFKKWGQIETVRLRGGAPSKPTQLKKVAINKKELHKDKSTISAYIRFATREEAEEAVKKGRGMILKDNHLVVDLAQGSGQGGDDGGKRDNKKAIFVGNLHLKVTDEELWRFFEPCGTITSVRVIRDNATGLGKGFGYVNFDSREAVDTAVKNLNQKELRGRSLRVSRCVKKLKIKKHKGQKNKERNSGGDREETSGFGGDKMAEIGKLRRKSNKPNRGEMKKAKIAKLLTGKPPPNSSSTWKPNRQRQPPQKNQNSAQNKKRYFN